MTEMNSDTKPDDAMTLMKLAQAEARRMGLNYAGTEQILLALIAMRETLSGEALAGVGLELEATRAAVDKLTGEGVGAPGETISFSPAANKVLDNAYIAASDLGSERIMPEHILLGLLSLPNGIAIQVLEDMDVNQTELRDVLLEMIRNPA